jgi:hypothetical protein
MKKITVFLIFLFLVTINHAQNVPCNKRTKFNYKLLKKEGLHIDTAIVRVDGIYWIKDYYIDMNKEKKERFQFIRFFKNGQMYNSCMYYHFPNLQELNSLKNGYYSVYCVKDSIIKNESFRTWAGYFFVYWNVSNNEIQYIGTSKRYFGNKNLSIEYSLHKPKYVFLKCDLKSEPFW